MSTSGDAERLSSSAAAGREPVISLRAVIDAKRRLDELGTARLIGEAAEAVHKTQAQGQALGRLSPEAITIRNGKIVLELPAQPAIAYSAPERLRGTSGDRRSDVFSLGVILWEALAHVRLFDGAGDDAIRAAVLAGDVAPPVSELNANVPAELDSICKKALARDPADRYQSAKVMAAEIAAVLDDAGYPEGNEQITKWIGSELGVEMRAKHQTLPPPYRGQSTVMGMAPVVVAPVAPAPAPVAPVPMPVPLAPVLPVAPVAKPTLADKLAAANKAQVQDKTMPLTTVDIEVMPPPVPKGPPADTLVDAKPVVGTTTLTGVSSAQLLPSQSQPILLTTPKTPDAADSAPILLTSPKPVADSAPTPLSPPTTIPGAAMPSSPALKLPDAPPGATISATSPPAKITQPPPFAAAPAPAKPAPFAAVPAAPSPFAAPPTAVSAAPTPFVAGPTPAAPSPFAAAVPAAPTPFVAAPTPAAPTPFAAPAGPTPFAAAPVPAGPTTTPFAAAAPPPAKPVVAAAPPPAKPVVAAPVVPTAAPAAPTLLASAAPSGPKTTPFGATTAILGSPNAEPAAPPPKYDGTRTEVLGSNAIIEATNAAVSAANPPPAVPAAPVLPKPAAAKPSISNAVTVATPSVSDAIPPAVVISPSLAVESTMPPPHPRTPTQEAQSVSAIEPGSAAANLPPASDDDFASQPSIAPSRPSVRGDKTGKGDVLAGWGWGTDSHEAIHDDDAYEEDRQRGKKRLLIAIGGAVGAVVLIIVIAFAFSSGSTKPKEETDDTTAKPTEAKPPAAAPVEPAKPEPVAKVEPAVDPGSAKEPEPAKVDPPAPPPVKEPEPAKVEPAKPEPAKVEPAKVEPAKKDPPAIVKELPTPEPAKKVVKKEPAKKEPAKVKKEPAKVVKKEPVKKEPTRVAKVDPVKPDPFKPEPLKLDAAAAYKTGLQQFARGDSTGALSTFKASLATDPGFAPTWRGIGLVYEKLGKKSQATTAFKRYLQLSPNAGDAEQIKGRLERLGS